ncbi:unnamed protein product, partial [Cyprideis torosa]
SKGTRRVIWRCGRGTRRWWPCSASLRASATGPRAAGATRTEATMATSRGPPTAAKDSQTQRSFPSPSSTPSPRTPSEGERCTTLISQGTSERVPWGFRRRVTAPLFSDAWRIRSTPNEPIAFDTSVTHGLTSSRGFHHSSTRPRRNSPI